MKLTIQVFDNANISEIVDAAYEGKDVEFCVFPHTLDNRVKAIASELENRDIDFVMPNVEDWGEMFVLEDDTWIRFYTSGHDVPQELTIKENRMATVFIVFKRGTGQLDENVFVSGPYLTLVSGAYVTYESAENSIKDEIVHRIKFTDSKDEFINRWGVDTEDCNFYIAELEVIGE